MRPSKVETIMRRRILWLVREARERERSGFSHGNRGYAFERRELRALAWLFARSAELDKILGTKVTPRIEALDVISDYSLDEALGVEDYD